MIWFRKLRIAWMADSFLDTLKNEPVAQTKKGKGLPKWFDENDLVLFCSCVDLQKYVVASFGDKSSIEYIVMSENPSQAWRAYCDHVLDYSPSDRFVDLDPRIMENLRNTKSAIELLRGVQLAEPHELGLESWS